MNKNINMNINKNIDVSINFNICLIPLFSYSILIWRIKSKIQYPDRIVIFSIIFHHKN